MSVQDTPGPRRAVTAGIDWAKDNHAICVLDADGEPIERFTVPHTKAGLARLNTVLDRHHIDDVGIERGDGPVIDALLAVGRTVFVIPPSQVKALRRRYGSAGNKDDRFDAYVLADTVRTDRRRLTPLLLDSEPTIALRKLCRARKDLVAHRVAATNQLRAHLQSALPAVVDLFRDLDSSISLRFLTRFTSQDAIDWLSPKRLAAWLSSVGYCGRADPAALHARITGAARGADGDYGQALAGITRAYLATITAITTQIEALAQQISEALTLHPDRQIFTSLPRSGTIRAARLLAEIGDSRVDSPPRPPWPASPGSHPRPASPAKPASSRSAGPSTSSCATPSVTSPATAATATLGPPASTTGHEPADTTTRTAYGSWPAHGSTSSGSAGPPTPPTTPNNTEHSNESSTKINP